METESDSAGFGIVHVVFVILGMHILQRMTEKPSPPPPQRGPRVGLQAHLLDVPGSARVDGRLLIVDTGGREHDYQLERRHMSSLAENGEVLVSVPLRDEDRSVTVQLTI